MRYISVDAMRRAIAIVTNGTLHARNPAIWGDGTTACASDPSTSVRGTRTLRPNGTSATQNCMVYINTLMLQRVLAQPKWANKLTPRDLPPLTPLIWDHMNPYGRFELDMNDRLPLE